MEKVIFAGGCFWCVEHDLRELPGVIDVVSGYSGGDTNNPTYENHETHMEAVEVTYNPQEISFKKLCQFFLDHIDPTDAGGQFFDRGESYTTAIFYNNLEEKRIAEDLLKELDESGVYKVPVAVKVLEAKPFFMAEDYHQRYADKNPDHYNAYAKGSGRKEFQNRVCQIREEKHIQWKD